MSKNIAIALTDLINETYAEMKEIRSLDFVERLFISSLTDITDHIRDVLGRQFEDERHQNAYEAIRDYCLSKHKITEAVSILQHINNIGDHDIVEYNIRVLATSAASYENSLKFWNKVDIVKVVDEILNAPTDTVEQPQQTAPSVTGVSLTAN